MNNTDLENAHSLAGLKNQRKDLMTARNWYRRNGNWNDVARINMDLEVNLVESAKLRATIKAMQLTVQLDKVLAAAGRFPPELL